jgi:hypothetical protein
MPALVVLRQGLQRFPPPQSENGGQYVEVVGIGPICNAPKTTSGREVEIFNHYISAC